MGKHSKNDNKKNKSIVIKIIRFLSIIVAICCIIYIVNWCIDNYKNKKDIDSLKQKVEISNPIQVDNNNIDDYNINFRDLINTNPDTVGWIKVNNTNIDYPIVKFSDNSYYLTHDFEKKYSGAGWIFANCNCICDGTDNNMVIFGHNRRDGSMFGSLKNVLKSDWYENDENRYILYKTESNTSVYKVFSVYQIELEDYYLKNNFKSNDEYLDFLNTIKSRSIYDFNVNLNKSDKIITLSTCANNNNYRVVLHAKNIYDSKN